MNLYYVAGAILAAAVLARKKKKKVSTTTINCEPGQASGTAVINGRSFMWRWNGNDLVGYWYGKPMSSETTLASAPLLGSQSRCDIAREALSNLATTESLARNPHFNYFRSPPPPPVRPRR